MHNYYPILKIQEESPEVKIITTSLKKSRVSVHMNASTDSAVWIAIGL